MVVSAYVGFNLSIGLPQANVDYHSSAKKQEDSLPKKSWWNHNKLSEAELIILLIDERPEEGNIERTVDEVVYSTDQLLLERARLVRRWTWRDYLDG